MSDKELNLLKSVYSPTNDKAIRSIVFQLTNHMDEYTRCMVYITNKKEGK